MCLMHCSKNRHRTCILFRICIFYSLIGFEHIFARSLDILQETPERKLPTDKVGPHSLKQDCLGLA